MTSLLSVGGRKKIASLALAAVLVTSFIVFVIPVPIFHFDPAFAQSVIIETSADVHGGKFFGEAMLQVIIEDDSTSSGSDDTIDVEVEYDESGNIQTETITVVNTDTGSQRFEFFIVSFDAADKSPNNPQTVSPLTDDQILEFGLGAGSDELNAPGASLYQDAIFTITYGTDPLVSILYEGSTGTLTLDRNLYGTDNIVYITIDDQDGNLDPTDPDSFTVSESDLNNILFDLTGATFVDDVTFVETSANFAEFEAAFTLTASDSATDPELVFSSNPVSLTLNDRADYTDVGSSVNTSTDTSTANFDVDDFTGTVELFPPVTFFSELGPEVSDNDQNKDGHEEDTLFGVFTVSGSESGSDSETFDIEETNENTGNFVPALSNDELQITFLTDAGTPTADNGVFEMRQVDIIGSIDVSYEDPLDDSSFPFTVSQQIQLETIPGFLSIPESLTPTEDFILVLDDPDLDDDESSADSYTFKFDGDGGVSNEFPLSKSGGTIGDLAALRIELNGTPLDFSTPILFTLNEIGPDFGTFESSEIDMAEILDSANVVVEEGDLLEITYVDKMESPQEESSSTAVLSTPSFIFFEQFGTSERDRASGVAADSSGAYVVGNTEGDIEDTNLGSHDAFIQKHNADGSVDWTDQFGTAALDSATAVALDSTGVYVVGLTTGALGGSNLGDNDVFVRKYTLDGSSIEWTTQFGSSGSDVPSGVAVDSSAIYIAGTTDGAIEGTSAGGNDAFVLKLSLDGSSISWTKQFGTSGFDQAFDVAVDSSGVYVVGRTNGSLEGAGQGVDDAFIRKYTLDGDSITFTDQFGTSGDDIASGVAVDSTGVYVVGRTNGSLEDTNLGGNDAFIRKYALDGNSIDWADQFGTVEDDSATGVAVDSTGAYVTGDTLGALEINLGGRDAFVRNYSLDGTTIQSTEQFGTTDSEVTEAIALGSVYVAGAICFSNEDCNVFVAGFESAEPADTTPPNHPPLSDLVSWYRAEGNFVDSVGNNDGLELSNNGGVDFTAGRVGQAFEFGGSDWIEIENDPSLNFGTGSFSVNGWIQATATTPMNIMVHGGVGCVTPTEAGWLFAIGGSTEIPSGMLGFDLRDSTGQALGRPIVTTTAPSVNEWHHIAAVVDRANETLYLYVDGQEVDTASIPSGFTTADNDGKPAIGANNRGGFGTVGCEPAGFFDGLIDEVSLHSRALSASEVQSIFEAGSAVLINSGEESTTSPDVTLTLSCTDAESGCDTIEVEFANIDADTTESVDEIEIDVHSTTNSTSKTLNALETGGETGIFILEIDVGDGTGDTIEFTDGDDIVATGTFFDSAEGTKSVEATFTDAAANSVIQSDSIELLSIHGTILWLNPLRDVTATTGFTISGNLSDAVTGEPISGELITFTGTGVTPSLQSVTTEGVTFTGTMNIVPCAILPTSCDLDEVGTDSDNSTNMVVHLDVGGKITFPAGTVTAKIYLQDMDDTNAIPFKYIVEENDGDFQTEANSTGPIARPIGTGINVVQIISGYTAGVPDGIKEITITEVDGSNSTGFVGIAAVLTGNPDGLPFEQHQINFEEFAVGPQASPFVVNSGHYFSTGFAQNIDANALNVTAHFAGSSVYAPSDSTEELYNVIANTQGIGGTGSETVSTEGGSITVATCSSTTDTDGDGICDIWETSGVVFGGQTYSLGAGNLANIDNFGSPNSGASTSAIDIFVEIDCMSGYCPTAADITALKAEFARESLNGKPFKLHVVLSDQTLAVKNPLHVWTDTDADSANDFANIKKNFFGTAADRSTGTLGSGAAKLIAKTQVFHYALFAKNINTGTNTACGPSGQAELNGNDIIVALGCGFTGTAGSDREKRGTLMHEMGHNLGLRHGGGDDDNCKPNLISVMSYSRQIPWAYLSATTAANARAEWVLTYSRQALINLDENFGDGVGGLVEGNGLPITASQWTGTLPSGSTQFKTIWGKPGFSPSVLTGQTGSPVNWNNAAGVGPYTQNINKLAGIKGCDTGTTVSILKSYDEWSRLNAAALNFRDGGTLDGFLNDDGSFELVYPDADTLPELTAAVLEGIKTASAVGPDNISNNPGASITPDIAVEDSDDDGNNDVYVVWSDTTEETSGKPDIMFKKSTDGGNTFGSVQNISTNSGNSFTPRIAVSGANLTVVWSDKTGGTSGSFDILMRRSLDGGASWQEVQHLSTNSGDSLTPDLAVDGSSVYVIWSDKTGGTSGSFDILFKKSSNFGVSWPSTSTNLSTNSRDSLTPAIGVSGNSVYAVWSDKTGGTSNKFDILSKNTMNAGVSWPSTSTNLSTNSGESLTPDVSVTPSGVYVVWSDPTGGASGKFDILMKKTSSLGGSFGAVQNVSTNSGDSLTPRVTASGASVYVTWVDKTGGTSGKFDILAKKSTDSGSVGSFEAVQNISADPDNSITPAIAIDGPNVYVTWGNGGSGASVPTSAEIMYALRVI